MGTKKDIIELKKRVENIAEIQRQFLALFGYEVTWKQPWESNVLVTKKGESD